VQFSKRRETRHDDAQLEQRQLPTRPLKSVPARVREAQVGLQTAPADHLLHRHHPALVQGAPNGQAVFQTKVSCDFHTSEFSVVRFCENVLSILLQSYSRGYLVRQKIQHLRMQHSAAIDIQRVWRGYRTRCWYQALTHGLILIQAHARGFLVRRRTQKLIIHQKRVCC
jgi:hypothetical protein